MHWFCSHTGRRAAHVVSLFLVMMCLGLSACNNPAPVKKTPSLQQKIDAYITSQVQQKQFRGTVLVAQNNHILLEKGYDYADLAQKIPNTPQTVYPIGQMTQQFTAMAVILLEQQGKLHNSDHICQYIPHCSDDWSEITIQDLITSYSDIADLDDVAELNFHKPLARDEILRQLENWHSYPRHTFIDITYTDYILLGIIIEKVSGEPYMSFLRTHLLDPLHMQHTGSMIETTNPAGKATGYTQDWHTVVTATDFPNYVDYTSSSSGGSLYSTVDDLYLWDQALANGTLIPSRALQSFLDTDIPFCNAQGCNGVLGDYNGLKVGYGGWTATDNINHIGKLSYSPAVMNGFSHFSGYYVDKHTTIIVLGNRDHQYEEVLSFVEGIEQILFS